MKRTVVLCSLACPTTNLNNEIGLDPFVSYTIADHLANLADEGIYLRSVEGSVYTFTDGSVRILNQAIEEVPMSSLDAETAALAEQADSVMTRAA